MGFLKCSLEELMYGVFMGDSHAMALKSAAVDLNIGRGAVLVQLQGPCKEDPFRFLALKWIEVRPPPVPVVGKMLVAPREVLFLGGTGTMVRPDTGEYIGYEVHHSVEHPAFLPVEGLRRTRVVIGSIYRPRPDGTVDLFIKSYSMEADMGKIMGSLAMSHASRCIERVWMVPAFAYAKKLRWCMDNRLHGNNKHKVPLCSSCRVKEVLADVDQLLRARNIVVRICSICRDFVKGMSALEIARQEMNQQRPAVFDPLTPNTLDVLARDFSLDNSFCTASVESLCMLETPRSDSERTEVLS
ncbi:hypothetical protein BBO99_00004415 [Phytophthora kernoviae]|uniref:Uncharacterized protein n=2 Tax=Phytophthora kernoviae TaxID=325452 RepID=A0A421FE20_9STRA|nr:hypothetical protein G195_007476 [Phytophthora kernoviae 00238/432]KAG2521897.1 hypothetical protein JM16_004924 [Phytophthora kernoviae]KAG2523450.1 hypothetical protein JM18_005732 [Phytophthora kernoviae]RLN38300.1 hypothetical protein BBI17_004762 [Phytophthora kernoviae]RLN80546.1 hypothetical protein BBO99_00004415 [Phytophthora kernoviae]